MLLESCLCFPLPRVSSAVPLLPPQRYASFRALVCLTYALQVTVSNPAEVAKTRLQLQGELAKGGGKRVYKHTFDVWAKTWRNEGIRGLQRGLPPAVSNAFLREFCVADNWHAVCLPGALTY